MPDLIEDLAGQPPLVAAACVGYLLLLAGDDAELDPVLLPHVQRFVQAAGLDAPGLDEAQRQQRVDAFFQANPLPEPWLAQFQENVDAIKAETGQSQARRSDEARRALGGGKPSLTPVGHTREPGSMRGGAAGLIHSKLKKNKTQR